MREPTLTRARAAAHETLFIKLGALTRQAEILARGRPGGAVPPETRAAAEALLYDAHIVLVGYPGRGKRPREPPKPSAALPPSSARRSPGSMPMRRRTAAGTAI